MHGDRSVREIRTIRRGQAGDDVLSINLLKAMAMTTTTWVTLSMVGEGPVRRGGADNEAVVAWVKSCRGEGKKNTKAGALTSD